VTYGLLALACRAFPRGHRARSSDEVVDTALLVARGSALRTAREAMSVVVAGLRQRLHVESHRSLRDGAALLAGVLALVNFAVALAGIAAGFDTWRGPSVLLWGARYGPLSLPFIIDGWWIAFTIAAAVVLVALVLGQRRLAVGAAMANLGLVAYDALFLENRWYYDGKGHFDVFTNADAASFPGGRQWLAAAIVLAVATAVARPRRLPLTRLPLALAVVGLLAWLGWSSRVSGGEFFFLRWPLAVVVLLTVAFGTLAPRLAILACGLTLAATPSVAAYLTGPNHRYESSIQIARDHPASWTATVVAAGGLVLGAVLPLVHLTRRRLA
jgi:hypothetical protein